LPFLKSLGWYPVIKQVKEYNNANYYISNYEYQIDGNQVLEIPILSEKQIEIVEVIETVDFATQKEQFMIALRNERNKKLLESDWTQLADVQSVLDEEIKNHWIVYRQALRDITENYISNDIVNIYSVNWPSLQQE
jgi:hypothetical protein